LLHECDLHPPAVANNKQALTDVRTDPDIISGSPSIRQD
jgi:hypothetical protein